VRIPDEIELWMFLATTVDAFCRPRIEWIAAGDGYTFLCDERVENRFLEGGGAEIRSERLLVDGNVRAAMRFVGNYANTLLATGSNSWNIIAQAARSGGSSLAIITLFAATFATLAALQPTADTPTSRPSCRYRFH
jgi:hypothetical protein